MEQVSQREMRNRSAELLRRVADGESVLVTNGGVPAAVIVPASAGTRERLVAAGRLRVGTGLDVEALPAPVRGAVSTEDVLTEDRG
jgi:prevent-host-death family protein